LFYFILGASLYFSWRDIRDYEISSWAFLLVFALASIFTWQRLFEALPFLLLAFLASRLNLGIGEGDFCLLALYALLFSVYDCIFILFLASALALIYVLFHRLIMRKWLRMLPFIPFLTVSFVIYNGLVTISHSLLTIAASKSILIFEY